MKAMKRVLSVLAASALTLLSCIAFAADCGTSGGLTNPTNYCTLDQFLAGVLQAVVVIAFPIVVLFIVYIGFLFVVNGNKPEELTKIKNYLLWAIVGALIVLGAQALALAVKGNRRRLERQLTCFAAPRLPRSPESSAYSRVFCRCPYLSWCPSLCCSFSGAWPSSSSPPAILKDRRKGRDRIVWGLVSIFVILSVWGLVGLLQQTFFHTSGTSTAGSTTSGGSLQTSGQASGKPLNINPYLPAP